MFKKTMEKKRKVLVVCKHSDEEEESSVCKLIRKEGFEIVYSWKNNLDKNQLDGVEFVISIGGDGTALSASHFTFELPLLAVNSNPKKSEGVLTTININELEKKLEEIKKDNFETEKLERIEAEINGKKIDFPALNEIFIANEKAYLVSKYKIKIKENAEEQRSSGLIFSTGTGSTAWFKSAGGKPFKPDARHIKMIVREPYFGKLKKFEILEAEINEGENAEIIPLTKMILAIDSIREIKINEKDRVKIRISDKPLLRIK